MASPPVFPCRRAGDPQEAEVKAHVTECFSPDMLQVFMDEQQDESNSNSPSPSPSPPMVPSCSPSQFPQFRHLPPELRCLVWEAALPEPTVVPRTWDNARFRYTLQRMVPPVLQACSESRGLLVARAGATTGRSPGAAPRYQLVRARGRGGGDDEGVYMNFDRESIWIYRGCKFAASRATVCFWIPAFFFVFCR